VQGSHAAYTRRGQTSALNRWFESVVTSHPPSLYRGVPVKLYYVTQARARPPTFVLFEGVHFSYRRYVANQLRAAFDLHGTPVRIVLRARAERRRPWRARTAS